MLGCLGLMAFPLSDLPLGGSNITTGIKIASILSAAEV